MERRVVGHEVGVDLLLASSDAFSHLADELVRAHDAWHGAGAPEGVLRWAQDMAEFAAWWCGRLEAEADHVAGFGSGGRDGEVIRQETLHTACQRRRWRRP